MLVLLKLVEVQEHVVHYIRHVNSIYACQNERPCIANRHTKIGIVSASGHKPRVGPTTSSRKDEDSNDNEKKGK